MGTLAKPGVPAVPHYLLIWRNNALFRLSLSTLSASGVS